mgnify:CR=1 FL=1
MGAEVEKKEMRGIETMTVQVPWKAILRFSIPLFIGSLFQQIYSMADAVIVGRLVGVKELAGVGATGAMSFLVIGFATGITSGFSVVIAQRAGAGDKEQIRTSAAACGWLCAAVTAVMTLLSTVGADPLLRLMNTPEDIFQYASGYIGIIFGGLGAAIYYNMIAGILRAVGDSRTPLYFLIFSSVLNVVLDLAAVLVFHEGVEGGGRSHGSGPAGFRGPLPLVRMEEISGHLAGTEALVSKSFPGLAALKDRPSHGTPVFRDSSGDHDPPGLLKRLRLGGDRRIHGSREGGKPGDPALYDPGCGHGGVLRSELWSRTAGPDPPGHRLQSENGRGCGFGNAGPQCVFRTPDDPAVSGAL